MKTWLRGHRLTRDAVESAALRWSRADGGKKARRRGLVGDDLTGMVDDIWADIQRRELALEPIRYFSKYEPSAGKVRNIGIETPKQQVCDYLAVDALMPMLGAMIGHWQCACVPGRGQLTAKCALEKWRGNGLYFIQGDIRKCFPSIEHGRLMARLESRVGSKDVLWLVESLIMTFGAGLDIGSYLSAWLCNWYLSFAYHTIEQMSKTRRGHHVPLVDHQVWYMDDFVLVGHDKRDLKSAMRGHVQYMRDELGLSVKPWKLCRWSQDEFPDLGGYAVLPDRTRVRGRTFLRARRAFLRQSAHPSTGRAARVVSMAGIVAHADCSQFVRSEHVHDTVRGSKQMVSEQARGLK